MSVPAVDTAYRVRYVPVEGVKALWPLLEPEVTRGLSRDDSHEAEDVKALLAKGTATAWIVEEPGGGDIVGVLTMQAARYPRNTALLIITLGGRDFDRWAPQVQAMLERYREDIGADRLEARCRPGMARKLERLGWRRRHIIMECDDGR